MSIDGLMFSFLFSFMYSLIFINAILIFIILFKTAYLLLLNITAYLVLIPAHFIAQYSPKLLIPDFFQIDAH